MTTEEAKKKIEAYLQTVAGKTPSGTTSRGDVPQGKPLDKKDEINQMLNSEVGNKDSILAKLLARRMK